MVFLGMLLSTLSKRIGLITVLVFPGLITKAQAYQVWVNFNDQVGQFADGAKWPVVAAKADGLFGPGRAVLKWTEPALLETVLGHAKQKRLVVETEMKHIVGSEAFRAELEKAAKASRGGLVGIMPYREPENKGMGSSNWGGGTLLTPEDLKTIRGRAWVGDQLEIWGLIRQFEVKGRPLGEAGKAFIKKELAGFIYEFGVPETTAKYDDVAAAAKWAVEQQVKFVMITPPKHFDREGNAGYFDAYRAFVAALAERGVDLSSPYVIFMPSGYTHKIKGVDFTPEGKGAEYPNTIAGVTRWLIDEREKVQAEK